MTTKIQTKLLNINEIRGNNYTLRSSIRYLFRMFWGLCDFNYVLLVLYTSLYKKMLYRLILGKKYHCFCDTILKTGYFTSFIRDLFSNKPKSTIPLCRNHCIVLSCNHELEVFFGEKRIYTTELDISFETPLNFNYTERLHCKRFYMKFMWSISFYQI